MITRYFRILVIVSMTAVMASAAAVEPAGPPSTGYVARALFTTEVVDREPTNRVLILANDVREIFFFTDLRGLEGQTVHHRWEFDGKVVSNVKYKVDGPRWRVYSRKELDPYALGKWTVVVTDQNGWPIKAAIFKYIDPAQDPNAEEIILPPEGGG